MIKYYYKSIIWKENAGTKYELICKCWQRNKELHREDGPAIEYSDSKSWWYNGLMHRDNGPAYEDTSYDTPYVEYWNHGQQYDPKNNKKIIKQIKY